MTTTGLPEPWQLYPMPAEQTAAIERYIERRAEAARQQQRNLITDLLAQAAAGRREYAVNAPDDSALVLESEARQLETVARLVRGDMTAMTAWLPSWRWTSEMTEHLDDARERHAAQECPDCTCCNRLQCDLKRCAGGSCPCTES